MFSISDMENMLTTRLQLPKMSISWQFISSYACYTTFFFLRLWFSYYVVSCKIAPEWIERQQCYCDFEVHPFFRSYRE